MKLFVISDIHGSFSALKKAIEIYNEGNYNKIIICGDILYHGARNPLPEGYNPKEVLTLLNQYKYDIIAVRGNCESEVDSTVLDFPVSADYSFYHLNNKDVFITHGHKYFNETKPPLKPESIILSGHTHVPMAEKSEGLYLFNPGSISLPKEGYAPTFGVLTDNFWEVLELDSKKSIKSINF